MILRVTTRSGAVYDLDRFAHKARRNADGIPVDNCKAEDGIWLLWLNSHAPIAVGARMTLTLAGPTRGPFERITTPVVSIEELDS